ncbi:uncharacterized protein C8Q71DRAFT_740754 [Rhodofomes roseus]|uniref:NAD(P)-dependent dehydrogenase (Short-subunit alcohol dehydrogenase family) n=1 Tax=Rhodofomes roseus TaxID=34475 RepID=A0ABQ8KQ16_9APHY|nr:uncharacterized protein C8Q71DRAFT_740754 [Rhodofomes roseus]KAH9840678.1 hypothetical protein C8Q71DRAFT_740754 [Rhodofomes roseus]
MRTYLVVGASRGIGLALVAELLKDPTTFVFATARAPNRAPGLHALASPRLSILELDVTDGTSVERAASAAAALLPAGSGLDCLIHNAAISLHEPVTPFEQVDLAVFQEEFLTNTVAPLHVVRAFLPLLRLPPPPSSASSSPASDTSNRQATKIVFVSSELGSLGRAPMMADLGGTYSVCKAGLGMLARKWGTTLKEEGICTLILHPGWVDTGMGNSVNAWMSKHQPGRSKMSAAESAARCLRVIEDARIEDAVAFYAYDGSRLPW